MGTGWGSEALRLSWRSASLTLVRLRMNRSSTSWRTWSWFLSKNLCTWERGPAGQRGLDSTCPDTARYNRVQGRGAALPGWVQGSFRLLLLCPPSRSEALVPWSNPGPAPTRHLSLCLSQNWTQPAAVASLSSPTILIPGRGDTGLGFTEPVSSPPQLLDLQD